MVWYGRFMRGNVFNALKQLDYTLAARFSSAPASGRILVQHISLPNSIPVIIVLTAIDVGALILTESALSFLGLGMQPPTASWGSMLSRSNELVLPLIDPATGAYERGAPACRCPGILITLTVLAFYLIGDGLRDALDPMLKNKR
ncbi:MAG: ABC transporter permease subunit [Caldilineaceae bacterium]